MTGFWSFFFGWYQGGVYSNLIASAVTGGGAAAFTLWRVRRHHERTRDELREHRDHLAEHHEATRTHVADQLALHAAAQNERLAVITDQIAALHARLDQQGGGQ